MKAFTLQWLKQASLLALEKPRQQVVTPLRGVALLPGGNLDPQLASPFPNRFPDLLIDDRGVGILRHDPLLH